MQRRTQLHIWYVFLALVGVMWFQAWWAETRQVEVIPYSQFEELLADGAIEELSIREQYLEGKLRSPLVGGRDRFVTNRVDPELAERLREHDVTFTGVKEDTLFREILAWLLPVAFFLAIWMFVFRRFADRQGLGGLTAIGKSKAKVYVETDTGVTFDDVAGVDEAKEELQEIINFLKDPELYGRLGAHIPKGTLLVGPPGTGKTLLARAVAGEAGVPFFSISGSEFVEMFVGVGAARVRDLFDQAAQAAPCIIFIDELDALGRARGVGPLMGGHDEKEQTLNQLLSEMDGFDPQRGIVILAATNRPEILDPALLRAGRFDRQVLVDRPERTGREAILKVHIKKVKLAADVDIGALASLTPGFSGADLANLVNEAALLATRRGGDEVTMNDFTNAIERIVAGLEKKSRVMSEKERRIVAHHEMGHALVAMALPGTDPVHKVSIIPRGIGSLGYTIQRPTEDRYLMTQQELENKMAVLLGGRAAEILVFDEISTGATDDLGKATDIARNIVTRFGMHGKLGQMTYEEPRHAFLGEGVLGAMPRNYSEETAREIDCAIREITTAAREKALTILRANRSQLDEGARLLLEKEVLQAEEIPRPEPLA
ncbi:MAG: ATP-dependent zinc metalloprotease FtsH [Gammaproteobacteria bacterium]|nr:ATP-dependent zinc metalloprotease FtsH [Gammaproteobacteria bacterium]MDH4255877.1 ATP-dependent zinc metalloprotease FtsH [Gammaproteobacteria bacterium]MDH5309474.1 ATP-dependent zinc metalloprotease FtsH [Gammaproteobacteria bacterium]